MVFDIDCPDQSCVWSPRQIFFAVFDRDARWFGFASFIKNNGTVLRTVRSIRPGFSIGSLYCRYRYSFKRSKTMSLRTFMLWITSCIHVFMDAHSRSASIQHEMLAIWNFNVRPKHSGSGSKCYNEAVRSKVKVILSDTHARFGTKKLVLKPFQHTELLSSTHTIFLEKWNGKNYRTPCWRSAENNCGNSPHTHSTCWIDGLLPELTKCEIDRISYDVWAHAYKKDTRENKRTDRLAYTLASRLSRLELMQSRT